MLSELTIENLGLIAKESIEFSPNFTAISGETGAGKSMLLSALHLLLGARANSAAVAEGKAQLSVDSFWYVKEELLAKIQSAVEDIGGEIEDGTLTVTRTVKSDGKSKASIGGRATTAKNLGEILGDLISVHGQSDQLRLKDSNVQLAILDEYSFAGDSSAMEDYRKSYTIWREASLRLKEVQANASSRLRELRSLEKFVEECEEFEPEAGELEILESTISRLKNHEKIAEYLATSYSVLSEIEVTPSDLMREVVSNLRFASRYDDTLEELYGNAELICDSLSELESSLSMRLDGSDVDALEELAIAQERLSELKGLLKRNGLDSLEALDEELTKSKELIEELNVYSTPLDELKENEASAFAELEEKAAILSALRLEKSQAFSKKINGELADLAMANTNFSVAIEKTKPSKSGMDAISFMIAQSGQKPQALTATASGGELSRIMLALELVRASDSDSKTFVFDEVDSGVGGKTALQIGKKLAELSRYHQVIVVSHLAQVVSFADLNLKVSKVDDGIAVATSVSVIDEAERPQEIARMLSGVEDSEAALEHSRELLDAAKNLRKGWK